MHLIATPWTNSVGVPTRRSRRVRTSCRTPTWPSVRRVRARWPGSARRTRRACSRDRAGSRRRAAHSRKRARASCDERALGARRREQGHVSRHHDDVEGAVESERGEIGQFEAHLRRAGTGRRKHRRIHVDTDDFDAAARELDRDPTRAATRIENGVGLERIDEVRLAVHVDSRLREVVEPPLVVVAVPASRTLDLAAVEDALDDLAGASRDAPVLLAQRLLRPVHVARACAPASRTRRRRSAARPPRYPSTDSDSSVPARKARTPRRAVPRRRPARRRSRRAVRAAPRVAGVRTRSLCRAVRELLELHGELDVGERAAAELEVELRVLAGRDALALDARLHPADLATPLFGERFAVHVLRARSRGSARPSSGSPATGRARVSAWNSHTSRPLAPVRVVARRASGRAGPACLRAAAARRCGTSDPRPWSRRSRP